MEWFYQYAVTYSDELTNEKVFAQGVLISSNKFSDAVTTLEKQYGIDEILCIDYLYALNDSYVLEIDQIKNLHWAEPRDLL